MDHAGLAGEPAADHGVGRQAGEVAQLRLDRALVGEGDLAHPDHLLHHHQVLADRAGQRRGRDVVGAGVHPGREPLLLQPVDPGQQVREDAGRGVHPQNSHHSGDPPGDDLGKLDRRSPAREPLFATAAGQMGVRIDEARDHQTAAGVDRLQLQPQRLGAAGVDLADPTDLVTDQKKGFLSLALGSEHLSILDQSQHVRFLPGRAAAPGSGSSGRRRRRTDRTLREGARRGRRTRTARGRL